MLAGLHLCHLQRWWDKRCQCNKYLTLSIILSPTRLLLHSIHHGSYQGYGLLQSLKGYWTSPRKQQQTLRCANSSDFFRREKTRPHHKVMNCFWFQFRFTTQNSYQTSCWTQGVLEMWEKSRKRKELKGEFIHCLIHNCERFGKAKWNSCKTDTSKTIINTYTVYIFSILFMMSHHKDLHPSLFVKPARITRPPHLPCSPFP